MNTEKDNIAKTKESVRLRQRSAAHGNFSLYLDIYWKGERAKESLNLFLIPEYCKKDKIKNQVTRELAEKIQAQRLMDLHYGKFGFKQAQSGVSFIDYVSRLARERLNSKGNYGNWDSALKHIRTFTQGKDITFEQVDEAWLNRFKIYLHSEDLSKGKKKLSQNSCCSYYNKVRAALRQAFEEKVIMENPAMRVKGIKAGEPEREFLTLEEIQCISQQPCQVRKLKEAFLFSILTGLRWSDIIKLTWSEVRGSQTEGWYLRFQQQKTKDYEVLPITQQARDLLGEAKHLTERVFIGLKYSAYTNVALSRWMLSAGIHKHITFHCARHSHATLLLSQGVDIYVVSKMLGHKHIKTTEIYTRVTNIKKTEALDKIPVLKIS